MGARTPDDRSEIGRVSWISRTERQPGLEPESEVVQEYEDLAPGGDAGLRIAGLQFFAGQPRLGEHRLRRPHAVRGAGSGLRRLEIQERAIDRAGEERE